MEIKIHTQNVELGQERETYLREKFEKLAKLGGILSDESTVMKIDFIHQESKKAEDAFECHLTIFVPNNTLRAETHSASLETAVDEVIEKVKSQIEHYKDKMHHISERH